MERLLINQIDKELDSASIFGWVDNVRDHGKLIFIDIRDRTGLLQCVCHSDSSVYEEVKNLTAENVISVKGKIKERPTKDGSKSFECAIEEIQVFASAEILPFEKDAELNIETLLDNRPLTLRADKVKQIFLVQEKVIEGFRSYMKANGFTEFRAPSIVGGDAEGGAEVFNIDYFGSQASLATSPQLYKQIMVGVFERVFNIGNVFRAEKHSTSRHLNEYTSLDFEVGFINDYEDVMDMVEGVVKEMKEKVSEIIADDLPVIPDKIPRMTLAEVKEKLGAEPTPDLTPEEERDICEYVKKEYNSDAVFVTKYPLSKRPMYTMPDKENPLLSDSFDLLIRGRETTTGSQRIHSYKELKESIESRGLDSEKFDFYLQAFKYGMPPHGGCGMGLERLTAAFLNISNVKEATLFPRDMTRIDKSLS